MDNVGYIALSRQMVLKRELDITANNIANMSTTGFKVESLIIGSEPGAPAFNDQIKTPANFAYDNGLGRDFKQGPLSQTGNSLDLAIEGDGVFFTLNGPNGPLYTRNGAFTLGADGSIMSQDGKTLMGDGGPILIDPKKASPTISADGVVSQGDERIGKIGLVRIDALSALSKQGDGTFALNGNQTATPATNAKLSQGFIEGSNVNSIKEITRLVEINRAYSSISNLLSQNQELTRSAIERLGRVA